MNKKTAAILAALPVFLLLLLALLPGREENDDKGKTFDFYSAFSASPAGIKGVFLLLKELGYNTKRILEEPGGEDWNDCNVVFLIEPLKPLSPGGLADIEDWVDRGGTLVVSSGAVMSHLNSASHTRYRDEGIFSEPQLPAGCRADAAPWKDCPQDSAARTLASEIEMLSLGQLGRSYNEKITHLQCHASEQSQGEGSCEVALFEGCRTLLFVKTFEKGRIIGLNYPTLLTNRNIQNGDNLKLVLNIIELAHAKYKKKARIKLGFDEYHRMLTAKSTSVWEVLGPGAKIAFYQFIFLFFFAAFGYSRRFAPAYRPADVKIRTSLMQTETLSAILDKTRSYGLALKIIHRHTARRWNRNAIRKTTRSRKLFKSLEDIYMKSHYVTGKSSENKDLLHRYLSVLDELSRREKNG